MSRSAAMWVKAGKRSWLLIALLCIPACERSEPIRPDRAAGAATEFIRLFASGKLSANAANALLGADATAERSGAYWQIRSRNGLEEIVLRAQTMDESTDDAELRVQIEAGITLRDFERTLGTWQLVSAGETSSVRFRVVDRLDKATVAYVRLFTPQPSPESPVLSVQLRRDEETKE